MRYSSLRLCNGGAAYEAVPSPRRSLDLGRIRSRLEGDGFSVIDARVMLIARMDPEVTIARDGRILIKSADPVVAERLFVQLLGLIGS